MPSSATESLIAGYLLLEGVATGSRWSAALADVGRVERLAAVEMLKECLEVSVMEQ